jgi:hypothetical protein
MQSKNVKLMETENRMLVTKGWGKEERELLINGCRVSAGKMKRDLEIDNKASVLK